MPAGSDDASLDAAHSVTSKTRPRNKLSGGWEADLADAVFDVDMISSSSKRKATEPVLHWSVSIERISEDARHILLCLAGELWGGDVDPGAFTASHFRAAIPTRCPRLPGPKTRSTCPRCSWASTARASRSSTAPTRLAPPSACRATASGHNSSAASPTAASRSSSMPRCARVHPHFVVCSNCC